MSELSKAIRVTATVSGGDTLARAFQALGFIVLARAVGQAGIGLWSYAIVFGAYAVMLVEFGFDSYAIRESVIRPADSRSLLRNVFGLRLAVAGAVCLAAIGYAAWAGLSDTSNALILVFVLACPATALQPRWKLVAGQKARPIVIAGVLSSVAFLAASLCVHDASQILWVALARTLGEYLSAVYAYAVVAGEYGFLGPAFEPERWRELWKGGLPFGVTRAVGESMHHIGVFFLGLLADPSSVGTFAVAYRFMLMAYLGFAGIQAGLYPILSGYSERLLKGRSSSRLLRNYAAVAFGAVVTGSALVSWFATEAVTLLFGAEFSDSAAVLRVLVWGLPFACLRVIAREAMRAEGKERTETVLMVVVVVLQAAACYLLIPGLGVMACAWAAVATELLLGAACVAVLAVRREHA